MIRPILIMTNIISGVILLLLSVVWFRVSALATIILLLASFDQFEDAYFYITGRSVFPKAMAGFDLGAEILQFVIAVAVFVLGASYAGRLENNILPYMTMLSGLMIAFSSIYDISVIFSGKYGYGGKLRGGVLSLEEGDKGGRRRALRRI
jgi:hypothetical protein